MSGIDVEPVVLSGLAAKDWANRDPAIARPPMSINLYISAHFVGVALGPPSSAEPANTLRPSGSSTWRAFAVEEPSLALKASMVTGSPGFKVSLRHPSRYSVFGGAPSTDQLTVLPVSSFTSI